MSSAVTTGVTSAAFLTCTPFPTTATTTTTATFTTTYTLVALAACPTSAWTATYTIAEVCTGNPATFTPASIPPNFVQTKVVCDVCATPTMTITCPVAPPAQTGNMVIEGNGVTAGAEAAMPNASITAAMPGSNTMLGQGPYATAGASSLKKGLAILGSVALVAGHFLLA